MFFFERRIKKLVPVGARRPRKNGPRKPRSRSFSLLFFKKEVLPFVSSHGKSQ
jgi:hypothetical protein